MRVNRETTREIPVASVDSLIHLSTFSGRGVNELPVTRSALNERSSIAIGDRRALKLVQHQIRYGDLIQKLYRTIGVGLEWRQHCLVLGPQISPVWNSGRDHRARCAMTSHPLESRIKRMIRRSVGEQMKRSFPAGCIIVTDRQQIAKKDNCDPRLHKQHQAEYGSNQQVGHRRLHRETTCKCVSCYLESDDKEDKG